MKSHILAAASGLAICAFLTASPAFAQRVKACFLVAPEGTPVEALPFVVETL